MLSEFLKQELAKEKIYIPDEHLAAISVIMVKLIAEVIKKEEK